MADIVTYECWAVGHPRERVVAADSWLARKAYAWKHKIATVDVIARRSDLVDALFDRLTQS